MMLGDGAKLRNILPRRKSENGEASAFIRAIPGSYSPLGMQLEFEYKPNRRRRQDYAVDQPTANEH